MSQLQQPWGDIDLQPKFRNLVYQAIEKPISIASPEPPARLPVSL